MAEYQQVLTISDIGKTYNEPVLSHIDLTLYAGKVLALTGENGAGKSTLSKIIGGLITPTTGTMTYRGQPYAPVSRKEAEKLGIRMVMQELNLLPTLTIAENLFLDQLPNWGGWIQRKRLREMAYPVMATVGLQTLDPDMLVGDLGIGHQQMIEIARNLIGESRVLILDEPTAMLTSREVALLFEQIQLFKQRGVSLIYISHRLDELAQIADDITVLRDGHLVCTDDITRYTSDQLVSLMVGRDLESTLDISARRRGNPILQVEHFTRGNVLQDISLTLHRGEVLGISGLVGAGRTELMRAIFGADRIDSGQLLVGDPLKPVTIRTPSDAIAHRIALVTEDRKGEGLLLPQSVAANTSLGNSEKVSRLSWLNAHEEQQLAQKYITRLGIRTSGSEFAVESLSGGNQQKVLISRWLERNCDVILFDEPTRGIDVGAKRDIYLLLNELTQSGKGLIVVSSDLRELMLICDRIAVLSAGRLVETFTRDSWTQDAILAAAFSGYQHATGNSHDE
ncbi:sugar ABC transporter ATP-binding protein [Kluyvera cryocrescens]|uniref:Sugar ABC transporter ATP-binding protein n=1 Tax=Kluyvera cryocrescens TaxID=580 RepID=A0AAW9CFC3_KLUCR|nr:sugar ABC transporter ATP-binding protein [Kluyvera cryocrescens]MDW3780392.1 sugar ABC transporter ATP-binding protein [Kluyvera cryocrescens]